MSERKYTLGVCSVCQQSGMELIYEDEHTVIQYHEAFGKICDGSYSFPETIYEVSVDEYLKASSHWPVAARPVHVVTTCPQCGFNHAVGTQHPNWNSHGS